jgi:hypothetical protein
MSIDAYVVIWALDQYKIRTHLCCFGSHSPEIEPVHNQMHVIFTL